MGADTMEPPSLRLCKGLLLTGEASPGVVLVGRSDRKGPWEEALLQAERRGPREGPRLLRWMLSGNKGCLEGRKSQIPLYLKSVTSAHRVHGCTLTVGVLTGVAMVIGVCSRPEIAQSSVPRGPQMSWVRSRLVCLYPSGALEGGPGP